MKDFMNNLHPTIKLTIEHSSQEISFLDMNIHIGAGTTQNKKPTDCATLLDFYSNHSLKCIEGIVFSQALTYKLLIADDSILQRELDSLTVSLLVITRNISKEPPGHHITELSSQ